MENINFTIFFNLFANSFLSESRNFSLKLMGYLQQLSEIFKLKEQDKLFKEI